MSFTSWGPLGKHLGGLWGCLGGLLARLEAILGVLGRCFGDLGPPASNLKACRTYPGEPRAAEGRGQRPATQISAPRDPRNPLHIYIYIYIYIFVC